MIPLDIFIKKRIYFGYLNPDDEYHKRPLSWQYCWIHDIKTLVNQPSEKSGRTSYNKKEREND